MNIKKNSIGVLAAVFGISAILYVLDVPKSQKIPSSPVITTTAPTIFPTIIPSLIPSIVLTSTPSLSTQSAAISPHAKPAILPFQPTIVPITKNIYSEMIDYQVRQFGESIAVSLTIDNAIVTNLTIGHTPQDGQSRYYHDAFDGEIQSLVVGKNIKDINVSQVAGASLTSDAFMQAINKVKAQI